MAAFATSAEIDLRILVDRAFPFCGLTDEEGLYERADIKSKKVDSLPLCMNVTGHLESVPFKYYRVVKGGPKDEWLQVERTQGEKKKMFLRRAKAGTMTMITFENQRWPLEYHHPEIKKEKGFDELNGAADWCGMSGGGGGIRIKNLPSQYKFEDMTRQMGADDCGT